MTANDTVILDDLTTGYRTGRSVKMVSSGISARLRGGELTCLLGPNGAGKSTLLRTLTGFNPPLNGKVMMMGREIGSYRASELARVVSVVLTERVKLAGMSVEELVGMGRAPYTGFWGSLKGDDRRIVRNALELVGAAEMADRAIRTLSDGERQKVMIAKALAQQTPVILLDEPTAFLDYPSKVEIMRLLHSLARRENKTIFLSTHDVELALRIADTIWLIDKAQGVTSGTPEDLAVDGSIARYIERPGIEFMPAEGIFTISTAEDGVPVHLTGDPAAMRIASRGLQRAGFRPTGQGPAISATRAGYTLEGIHFPTLASLINELRHKES